jgi:hypothetical protein
VPRRTDRWPVAIFVVAVAVVALGAVGIGTERPCRLDNCLYASLQLFVLEFPSGVDDPPLALNTARFLAPLVLGWAVVLATLDGARQRVTEWRLWATAHDHVVVLGLTGVSAAAAIEARQSRSAVVVADPDPDPQLRRLCRRHDIDVISERTTHSTMLAKARAARARTLLIATGDDAANLQALASVRTLPSPPGTSYVEISHVRLWAALHSLSLGRDGERPEKFFCPPDRVARIVLDHWLFDQHAGRPPTLLVYGHGPVAERLVVHAVHRADPSDDRPILLGGPAASGLRSSVLSAVPWLEHRIAIAEEGRRADVALVVGLTDAEALAAARPIARTLLEDDGRALIAVSDDAVIDAATLVHLEAARVRLVPTTSSVLAAQLLHQSAVDVLAEAKHEDYVMRELRRGGRRSENASLVPWRELPESLRRSNRRFAESVDAKLAALGALLEPLGDDPPPTDLVVDEAVLEELAHEEHERWRRDLEQDGWRYGAGPKDPARKLHPLLVDWDELPAPEQEKDRDTIRGLPGMLARVGYRMTVPGDG